ncbi:uncharacterized protein LOC121368524 [Gigantopelta aegis]|uniref:uncharacterized protein LOC121368524 n=1 Tax=Gigantopelta aegis TaxID=1735272 RepID=UPI001B88C8C1|nr:uncharacterized protein LOC121368524 [Gigantopelta aegis]
MTKKLTVNSASAPTTVSPRQPGKPTATEVGSDYISITWDQPEEKHVTYYEIKLKPAKEATWLKVTHFTDGDSPVKQICDLDNATEYEFKVRGYYNGEEGPFSDKSDPIMTKPTSLKSSSPITSVSPRKPGKPTELDVEDDFILLGWNKPYDRNVTYYEIKLKQLKDSTWTKMSIFTDNEKSVCHVSGLLSSATYEFKVRPYYGEEEGEYSDKSDPITTTSTEAKKHSSATHAMYATKQLGRETRTVSTKPSKPYTKDTGIDYIDLYWEKPEDEGVLYYEVRHKPLKESIWNENSVSTQDDTPEQCIRGLLQETEYVFKVRAKYNDVDGEFSDQSNTIRTNQSPAFYLTKFCTKLQDGEPTFYKLPLQENVYARNEFHKTRKFEFGSEQILEDKTIMMIGATGSGKSTLIDGMVNHFLGVQWKDNFRFKLIDLTMEEEEKHGRQTESQTEWITSYRVHPIHSKVNFSLNIIDTPGFGDTRGIERDHQLVEQIRAFFTSEGIKGIETIDAICFVTQAPLARMTHTQRYIFDAILSIFGKDMAKNIVAMITFADGKEPPVLNALMQAKVPYNNHFVFNNSALFEPNTEGKCNTFAKMFWEMGAMSYDAFFEFLPTMKTQSLQLTAQVLKTREELNATIHGLMPQIDIGLHELATMKAEQDLVNKFEREIRDNKNFQYQAVEFHQTKIPLERGQYVTNCSFCHMTCHFPCHVARNDRKFSCSAMKDGICNICPEHCSWDTHKCNDHRLELNPVTVQKTYSEMKIKYEFAAKEKVSKQRILHSIKMKFSNIKSIVRNNAIKANPLTEVQYVDLLIQSELREKTCGFKQRVKMLHIFRKQAELTESAMRHDDTGKILKDLGFEEL